jgi:hypothetical protein
MSKYNVSKDKNKRTYDGIIFDSTLEMKYYRDVVIPALATGAIQAVSRQLPYILQPSFKRNGKAVRAINYVADFVVTDADNNITIIDIKGMSTSEAKLKRKMFYYVYPDLDYKWIAYSKKYGGWIDYDELQTLKRRNKNDL